MNITRCFNDLLQANKWLRCSTAAQNARYVFVYVIWCNAMYYVFIYY